MAESFGVLCLGSGGTGTYFIKEACRYLSTCEVNPVKSFIIMDGDTVERKNLSRQAFTEDDIGRNKAEAMSEAVNEVYGMDTQYIPEYLTSVGQLSDVFGRSIPVIISCVDNHAARLVTEAFFEKRHTCILYDSANEYEAGEVVYANKVKGEILSPVRSHYFPDIKRGDLRAVTEMSCEELNQSAPQHIFTNMCAGLALLSAFSRLIEGDPMLGMAMFNPRQLSMEFFPYKAREALRKAS